PPESGFFHTWMTAFFAPPLGQVPLKIRAAFLLMCCSWASKSTWRRVAQTTTSLGMLLDSTTMRARPSVLRVADILQLVSRFRLGRRFSYITFL
ncbi:hypothetical protein GOODEAATRI_018344, partial [Goodea atripinnis]